MATKIRLQRFGRKRAAYYHIVVADSRAPRNGRFIERIGSYNPNTNPATIDINFDRALHWVQTGAQPTETMHAILRYKGVMMKDHLLRGVTKGALTLEAAEAKFEQWLADKAKKVQDKVDRLKNESSEQREKRLKEEAKVKEAIAAKVAAKRTPPPAETEEAPVAETSEAVAEPAEAVAEPAAEENETPAAE